jgi:hypothetical protein
MCRGCARAGLICTRCSPLQVANDAIFDARSICMREYATAPEVTVYGDPGFTFPYVPSHLHHMTFELVRVRCLLCCLSPASCNSSFLVSMDSLVCMMHPSSA